MRICIVARKRLGRNTRVYRQAKALTDEGHEVTVVALELPTEELRARTPSVRYIQVEMDPWPAKFIRFIHRLRVMPQRMGRHYGRALQRTRNRLRFSFLRLRNLTRNRINKRQRRVKQSQAVLGRSVRAGMRRAGRYLRHSCVKWRQSAIRKRRAFYACVTSGALNTLLTVRVMAEDLAYRSRSYAVHSFVLIKRMAHRLLRASRSYAAHSAALINRVLRRLLMVGKYMIILMLVGIKRAAGLLASVFLGLVAVLRYIIIKSIKLVLVFLLFLLAGPKAVDGRILNALKQDFITLVRRLLLPYMNSAKTVDFSQRVSAMLGNERFDYCQAHDSYALLAARRLADNTGGRLVYDALEAPDERSGISQLGTPQWVKRRESSRDRRIIRTADMVFSVGPALADWTRSKYGLPETPTVVRNCALYRPSATNDNIRNDLGMGSGEQLGIVIGSIYRDQGIEQLIDSMLDLDARTHIALLGPVAQPGFDVYLKTLIKECGVGERFHILEPQPPHLVLNYASGADIGIIARQATTLNNRLSLPNKVFELIMARLPIASGRLPNIEAIVREYKLGAVFDETDPADIARVINGMLSPDTLPRLKEAVNEAAGECCWENESLIYTQALAVGN